MKSRISSAPSLRGCRARTRWSSARRHDDLGWRSRIPLGDHAGRAAVDCTINGKASAQVRALRDRHGNRVRGDRCPSHRVRDAADFATARCYRLLAKGAGKRRSSAARISARGRDSPGRHFEDRRTFCHAPEESVSATLCSKASGRVQCSGGASRSGTRCIATRSSGYRRHRARDREISSATPTSLPRRARDGVAHAAGARRGAVQDFTRPPRVVYGRSLNRLESGNLEFGKLM